MTLVMCASNTRVNADTPRAYKNLFLKTASTNGMNDARCTCQQKMCFKGDYKWDFSLHFLFLHHVDNSHIQCKTVKCMSLDSQFAVIFLCRIYWRRWKVHYTWTYMNIYIYMHMQQIWHIPHTSTQNIHMHARACTHTHMHT